MAAQTVTWWVFLALTQYASSHFTVPYEVKPGSTSATEGSCFEIKCTVTTERDDRGAYWFWRKKAQSDKRNSQYEDTVIFSSNKSIHSISPEFEGRVQYLGDPSKWKSGASCTILICDLKTSDKGNYYFTYHGSAPLVSPIVQLTIKGNPCPLTFDQPPAVMEQTKVTLTCSTSTSCPSGPQIQDVSQPGQSQQTSRQGQKSITVTFTSSRDDNGKVFSCKTRDNKDKYLIRNVTVSVHYPPVVGIKINSPSSAVKNGNRIIVTGTESLNLTCDVVRSNPQPDTFTWTRNGIEIGQMQTYTQSWLSHWDQGLYRCTATNKAGRGTSDDFHLDGQYSPRETTFSVSGSSDNTVKVEQSVTFTCNTDANPDPMTYTWFRDQYHQGASWWKDTNSPKLTFKIQRADAACYRCSATNLIGTGYESSSVCVQVLYPPSPPQLNMPAEVTGGQSISVSCSAEGFPKPTVTLIVFDSSNRPIFTANEQPNNGQITKLNLRLTVTPAHAGLFRCSAHNTEGTATSRRRLVVKYAPINVRVKADPGLTVKETEALTLSCLAESYPLVSAVTWVKTTDGKDEIIQKNLTLPFTVNSASPSDSGLYSCEATNQMGSGKSQPAAVEVKYAPKNANITGWVERQERDGRSSVTLSCISHSFPPVHLYSWHRKIEGMEKHENVSTHQNYTVYSDQPGLYFCTAKNKVGQRSSDPVRLFEHNFWYKLRFIVIGLLVLMIIIIIIFILRYRRKKYQQGTRNTFVFGYMARRRSLTNELVSAEPFRSRDNLLSAQMSHPQAQRHQPLVDDPPRANVIYSILNLPQGASAQNQAGHTEANSTATELSYASLHLWKRPKVVQSKAEEHALYAAVSKSKKLSHEEKTQDYENVSASKSPNLSDNDEGDVNYSQVSFAATPRRQVTNRDSSSSSEEESQYSDIRI